MRLLYLSVGLFDHHTLAHSAAALIRSPERYQSVVMTSVRFTLTVRYIELQKLEELLVRLFPNKNFGIDVCISLCIISKSGDSSQSS